MLSPSTIDAIHQLPIEDVIGRYVDLKKAGGSFKACCPLHGHGGEKTPSFHVTPAKNIYKCFGCGSGGDAIRFVMEHEGLTFYEACLQICKDHGIDAKQLADTQTPAQKEAHKLAETVLNQAQAEYRSFLIK